MLSLKIKNKNLNFYYIFGIIFLSIFVYIRVLHNINIGIPNEYINIYDGPSYYEFSFDSLKTTLSQHRTFGFPLFMKIYRLFDYDLIYWSLISYIFYIFSILVFYIAGSKFNLDKNFLFIFCSGLVFSKSLYHYLGHYTEFLSISLFLISSSLFLIAIQKKKFLNYFYFSIIFFFCYQVRPSMILYLFFFITFIILYKYFINSKIRLLPSVLSIFLPLFLFLILRFAVVGDFAIVSFNMGTVGNSIIYMEKINLNKLKKKNQEIAKKLLERKKKLPFPCNLEGNEKKYPHVNSKKHLGQFPCWWEYTLSSWFIFNKLINNIEPFPEGDKRNTVPWLHFKTLSGYFNQIDNYVEINRVAKNFATDVYSQSLDQIFSKLIKSPIYFLKFQKINNLHLINILLTIFFMIFIFVEKKNKIENKFGPELVLFISFIITLFPTFYILYIYVNADGRALMFQTFYFVPICMSYLFFVVLRNANFRFLF